MLVGVQLEAGRRALPRLLVEGRRRCRGGHDRQPGGCPGGAAALAVSARRRPRHLQGAVGERHQGQLLGRRRPQRPRPLALRRRPHPAQGEEHVDRRVVAVSALPGPRPRPGPGPDADAAASRCDLRPQRHRPSDAHPGRHRRRGGRTSRPGDGPTHPAADHGHRPGARRRRHRRRQARRVRTGHHPAPARLRPGQGHAERRARRRLPDGDRRPGAHADVRFAGARQGGVGHGRGPEGGRPRLRSHRQRRPQRARGPVPAAAGGDAVGLGRDRRRQRPSAAPALRRAGRPRPGRAHDARHGDPDGGRGGPGGRRQTRCAGGHEGVDGRAPRRGQHAGRLDVRPRPGRQLPAGLLVQGRHRRRPLGARAERERRRPLPAARRRRRQTLHELRGRVAGKRALPHRLRPLLQHRIRRCVRPAHAADPGRRRPLLRVRRQVDAAARGVVGSVPGAGRHR